MRIGGPSLGGEELGVLTVIWKEKDLVIISDVG